jgi:hypothetical protein
MSAFKPKRINGETLVAQISPATSHLPAAVPLTQPEPAPAPARTVQINFKASESFADLLAAEAVKAGSTRRFLARLMKDAGYPVPEIDLNPPDSRKRGRG